MENKDKREVIDDVNADYDSTGEDASQYFSRLEPETGKRDEDYDDDPDSALLSRTPLWRE